MKLDMQSIRSDLCHYVNFPYSTITTDLALANPVTYERLEQHLNPLLVFLKNTSERLIEGVNPEVGRATQDYLRALYKVGLKLDYSNIQEVVEYLQSIQRFVS